jgi:hypothetical protein
MVDMSDLGQVFHHEKKRHRPLIESMITWHQKTNQIDDAAEKWPWNMDPKDPQATRHPSRQSSPKAVNSQLTRVRILCGYSFASEGPQSSEITEAHRTNASRAFAYMTEIGVRLYSGFF